MPARNEKYLEFIRKQWCCIDGCFEDCCDPHHVFVYGLSLKCSDYATAPMCRNHHTLYHSGSLTANEKAVMERTIYRVALKLLSEYLEGKEIK